MPKGAVSAVGFRVVREEFGQPDVRQRVFHQALNGAEWAGHHVSPKLGAFDDMHGTAHTGRQDFGAKIVVVEDVADVFNEVHAVRADVVEATDEGAYE